MRRAGLRTMVAVAAVLAAGMAVAGNMSDYKDTPTFHQADPRDCGPDDVGSVQVSCRYIEVGSIDGYQLGGQRKERDPRWSRLKKYQLGSMSRLKFAGIACGRGKTEQTATSLALGRAANAMKEGLLEWEERTFTGELTGLGFNKYDDGYSCTRVANTSGQHQPVVSNTPSVPRSQARSNSDRQQAEAQRLAKQKARAQDDARKRRATFIITSKDRYSLGLAFYSQNYDREWPGNGKQYILHGTKTYNLSCTPGEKICFGAWRDHQITYWGVGRKGKQNCQRCCIQCGQTFETNLSDGGPDAYPQTSSGGGQVLNEVLGIIGLGGAIYKELNGQGGGTYSAPAPAPRGNAHRPSGISR